MAEVLVAVALLGAVLVFAVPVVMMSQGIVRRSDGTEVVRSAAVGAVEALRMVPFDSLDAVPCPDADDSVLCDTRQIEVDGVQVRVDTVVEAVAADIGGGASAGMKRVVVTATLVDDEERSWEIATLVAPDGAPAATTTTPAAPSAHRTLTVTLSHPTNNAATGWPELRLYGFGVSGDLEFDDYLSPTSSTGIEQVFTLTQTGTGFGPFFLTTGSPVDVADSAFGFDQWQLEGSAIDGVQGLTVVVDQTAVEADVTVYLPVWIEFEVTADGAPVTQGQVLLRGVGHLHGYEQPVELDDECVVEGAGLPCAAMTPDGLPLRPGYYDGTAQVDGYAAVAEVSIPVPGNPPAADRRVRMVLDLEPGDMERIWVRVVDEEGWGVGTAEVRVCVFEVTSASCIWESPWAPVDDEAGYAELFIPLNGDDGVRFYGRSESGKRTGYANLDLNSWEDYGEDGVEALAITVAPVIQNGTAAKEQRMFSKRRLGHLDVRQKNSDSGTNFYVLPDLEMYEVVAPATSVDGCGEARVNRCRPPGISTDAAEWAECSGYTRPRCHRISVATRLPDLRVGFFSYCDEHAVGAGGQDDIDLEDAQLSVVRKRWFRWNGLSSDVTKDIGTRLACPDLN